MWFIRSLDRLDDEMRSIAALVKEGWVKRATWQVTPDCLLCAEVTFSAGGKLRDAQLLYPQVFPYAPPRVIPKDGERWSSHQWPSGELCLQFRAKTWSPELTGADLLCSARHLLDTEATTDGKGVPQRVPSAPVSDGLMLLGEFWRFFIHDDVLAELNRRGVGTWKLKLYDTMVSESNVVIPSQMMAMDGSDAWKSPSVPEPFLDSYSTNGLIALVTPGDKVHKALTTDGLSAEQVWSAFTEEPFKGHQTVIGVLSDQVIAKYLSGESVRTITQVPPDRQNRNPARNDSLTTKKVGIIGCGSMGSKVAASLARSGVGKFVLIDGDILKDGNLVRHELDWSEVGAHKTVALKHRLQRIRPGVEVNLWRINLGHSSTEQLLRCMKQLSECDLLVEVTGDAQGFNYAGALAAEHNVPMVWGRVFAGGYGGLLARSRPGLDPSPHEVRNLIHSWCNNPEFPDPPRAGEIDYSAEADDQPAMIADDGDVMTISGMLARFAADTLRSAEQSDYPYSAYMVGLRKEWIFTEPYQTFPIDLGGPRQFTIELTDSYLSAAKEQIAPAPFPRKAS